MFDIALLTRQVQRNCDISDARYGGYFSVCGLALRLRDLYKWEKEIPPWREQDSADVLAWIGDREERWSDLSELELCLVTVDGRSFDAFETGKINDCLESMSLFYGAGLAHGLKPTFFLAPVRESFEKQGCPVIVLGRELARDLLTLPAMVQDRTILFREESARGFFWDQLVYLKKSGRPFLAMALEPLGIEDLSTTALRKGFERLFLIQRELYIQHEIGEMESDALTVADWRQIVAAYAHTPVELLARALKDLLADSHPEGTLSGLIRSRNTAGLCLYCALVDGLMLEIFREIRPACRLAVQKADWRSVEMAAAQCRTRVETAAKEMVDLFEEGKRREDMEWARKRIEAQILGPFL